MEVVTGAGCVEETLNERMRSWKKSKAELFHLEVVNIELLSQVLKTNDTLKKLQFWRTCLGENGAALLADALKINQALEELVIAKSGIGKTGAGYIAEALGFNTKLTKLALAFERIGAIGAKKLAKGIMANNVLTSLTLRENKIGDKGCEYLSEALKANQNLNNLSLTSNRIGDTGVRFLFTALKTNCHLMKLDLSDNTIGSVGAKSIANGLLLNKSLAVLYLNRNRIGDMGLKSLANALKVNSTLSKLSLKKNRFGDSGTGIQDFVDVVKLINKSLIEVNLFGNSIHRSRTRDINLSLLRNKEIKQSRFNSILNSKQEVLWRYSRLFFIGSKMSGKSSTVKSLLGKRLIDARKTSFMVERDDCTEITESKTSKSCWKETNSESNTWSLKFTAQLMLEAEKQQELKSSATMSKSNLKISKSLSWNSSTGYHSIPLPDYKVNVSKLSPQLDENKSCKSKDLFNIHEPKLDVKEQLDAQDEITALLVPTHSEEKSEEYDISSLLIEARRDQLSTQYFSIWDFAGGAESIFCDMNHVFLTKSGLYILSFDTREFFKDPQTCRKHVFSWLKSLSIQVAGVPIFLVGTFVEASDGVHEEKSTPADAVKTIDSLLRHELSKTPFISQAIVSNEHDQLMFFPIDNQSGLGISNLQAAVEHTAASTQTRGSLISSGNTVSIKWMVFLDELLSMKQHNSFLSIKSTRAVARRVGIVCSSEQEEALSLFHEKGAIVYLKSTDKLRSTVVLDPKWLVNALAKLTNITSFYRSVDVSRFETLGLKEDLELISKRGIATRDLLEQVWTREELDYLMDLMKKSMLLTEWNFGNRDTRYLIPSLTIGKDDQYSVVQSKPAGICCTFDFSRSILPGGLFQRLLCLCVAHSSLYSYAHSKPDVPTDNLTPKLYENYGFIPSQAGPLVLLQDKESFTINLYIQAHGQASKAFTIINSMLRKISRDVMNTRLVWDILFENTVNGSFVSYSEANKVGLNPWFETKHLPKKKKKIVDLVSFFENI